MRGQKQERFFGGPISRGALAPVVGKLSAIFADEPITFHHVDGVRDGLRKRWPQFHERPVWTVGGDWTCINSEPDLEQVCLYVREVQDRMGFKGGETGR